MLQNYLKTTFRNLVKNSLFSAINIFGLATSLTAVFFIALFVIDELSYDKFHEKGERMYRVFWNSENPQTRVPYLMSKTLPEDFTQIEQAVSLTPLWGPGLTIPTYKVQSDDRTFEEKGFYAADSGFFEVFTFEFIEGDAETAFGNINSVVITESIAKKFFDKEAAIGKTLKVGDDENILAVSGVIKDIPDNSHFEFSFLVSYDLLKLISGPDYFEWGDFGHYVYLVLGENSNPKTLQSEMIDWSGKYIDWSESSLERLHAGSMGFELQALHDIHLNSDLRWELGTNGNMLYVNILIGAAIFILLVAIINFSNLFTASALDRSREVGVRKVLGSGKLALAKQIIAESIIFALLSGFLAAMAVCYGLPWFNSIAGKTISLMANNGMYMLVIPAVVLIGVVAGLYPSIYLSSFKILNALKNRIKANSKQTPVTRGLLILQFSVSAILLIGTIAIVKQVDFIKNHSLGFQQDQVIVLPLNSESLQSKYKTVKSKLTSIPGVVRATAVSNVPGKNFNQNPIRWVGGEEGETEDVSEYWVDEDFFTALEVGILKGRAFSEAYNDDQENNFIINEATAKLFDWEDPIGEELIWYHDDDPQKGKVIGVVNDFHVRSLKSEVSPLAFHVLPSEFNYLLVKVKPDNIDQTLNQISEEWRQFDEQSDFSYYFLSEEFQRQYEAENKLQSIIFIFSGLAVLIACLGLYGLTTYTTRQRKKEFSIRKVMGATLSSLVILVTRQFSIYIIMAYVLAVPISIWVVNEWMNNFAYKVELGFDLYLYSLVGIVLISFVTMSIQAIRSANSNPVDSLKSE
ncbi:MAG: ABC transporter permease [Bacteroidota bacterium]